MMSQIKICGYTLFELLISLTIIVLIASFACSHYASFLRNQTSHHMAYQILHLLQFARSEAIKRNQVVTLCKSRNLATCDPQGKGSIIVFTQNEIIRVIQDSTRMASNQLTAIKYSPTGHSLDRKTLIVGDKKIVIYDSGRARIE